MASRLQAAGPGAVFAAAAGIVTKTFVVALTFGATVHAQEQVVIEEIIVTATRREESMQDIPVAVTAVTGEMLTESGVQDVFTLQEQAPALVVSRSQQSTVTTFSIRGIGTSSQNFGLESSVGLYVDDVYRSRQSSLVNNLVDIDTVEILRGPQGTLFGKNTPSGAVIMRTVSPFGTDGFASNEANAFVEVTGGDLGLVNISAASNIPLKTDVLALRATIFSAKRDGYVAEITQGADLINDIDRQGGRLQLGYTPNDRFSMRVIADYAEIDETCCAALTRQDSITAFGRDDGMGGPVFGTDAALLALGGTVFTGEQFEDRMMALNRLPNATNEDRGLSVQFDYDFENSTLTSISAYRAFDTFDRIDADFSDVDMITKENNSEQNSFSQELRLAGDWGERTRYVAGAFFFQQDLNADNTLFAEPAFAGYLTIVNPTVSGVTQFVDGIAAATEIFPGPPLNLPPTGLAFPPGTFAREIMLQDHQSWAVFAQFDFDLTERVMLTAGLRYTDETKDLNGVFLESPLGPPPDVTAILTEVAIFQSNPAAYNPYTPQSLAALAPVRQPGWGSYLLDVLRPRTDVNETLQDDRVSGTVKLSWQATDDMLLYASYGTGYKSGGTNTDRINEALPYLFDAETSQAFELGMKSQLANGRVQLNVAAHKTDFEDLQANSFTGLGFNLSNAGKAETHGAEVELMWLPIDLLRVQAAYTWSVADFADFLQGTCWVATPFHTGVDDPGRQNPSDPFCDRSGGRHPDNPEHNLFLAATLDIELGANTTLFIRPEFNYYSDTMTDGNNEPLKLRDSYQVWNLRAGLHFESIDADLTVWGRNIADDAQYETIFDVPIQDGKLNAYPREPRTWGVTFRKNF